MASVEIKLFASLREAVGIESHVMNCDEVSTVKSLLDCFASESSEFNQYYSNHPVLVAVNKPMVEHSYPIQNNDEVALFPPVTGG